jgi:hypothetical protein
MGDFVSITRTVKARKQHRCFLCPMPIQKGEHYLRWAYKSEGDCAPVTTRAHPACNAYADREINDYTNGNGVAPFAVSEDLREEFDFSSMNECLEEYLGEHPEMRPLVEYLIAAGQ